MIRFLLDEHYPPSLVTLLREYKVEAVSLLVDHPELLGATDATVLQTAASLGYVVVTEDVSTFPLAIRSFQDHIGVVFCRSNIFDRSQAGIRKIAQALFTLAQDPPAGMGVSPVIWWLQDN